MNRPSRNVRLLPGVVVLLGCTTPWGQGKQQLEARITTCESFVLVKHGDRSVEPKEPPQPHPSSLTVEAKAYLDAGAGDTISFDLRGRASPVPQRNERQLLTFETTDGREPVHVTGVLPFDLGKWMGAGTDGRMRYEARSSVLGHDRSLSLDATGSGRMLLLQRHGSSPIGLDLNEQPIELGVKGLSVAQTSAQETARLSSGCSYALPLEVRTADGRTTSLWQGQGLTLVDEKDGHAIGIFVLVSQVNRPQGKAVAVAEGDPFGLELLIFQVSP